MRQARQDTAAQLLQVAPAPHLGYTPRIDAEGAGAGNIKREKAADHRDVLQQMDELIAALRGVGHVPEAMADQCRDEREQASNKEA